MPLTPNMAKRLIGKYRRDRGRTRSMGDPPTKTRHVRVTPTTWKPSFTFGGTTNHGILPYGVGILWAVRTSESKPTDRPKTTHYLAMPVESTSQDPQWNFNAPYLIRDSAETTGTKPGFQDGKTILSATLAYDEPAWARVHMPRADSKITTGQTFGPVANTGGTLYPGLPGFVAVWDQLTRAQSAIALDDGGHAAMFVQPSQAMHTITCRAVSKWTPQGGDPYYVNGSFSQATHNRWWGTVECEALHPYTFEPYDGLASWRPRVHFIAYLHFSNTRQPNIVIGQKIDVVIRADSRWQPVATGSEWLDDPVGTIKQHVFYNADGAYLRDNMPQGWALCNGTDNSVANFGSGVNLVDRMMIGAGTVSDLAEVREVVSNYSDLRSAGGGTNRDAVGISLIERIDNSKDQAIFNRADVTLIR